MPHRAIVEPSLLFEFRPAARRPGGPAWWAAAAGAALVACGPPAASQVPGGGGGASASSTAVEEPQAAPAPAADLPGASPSSSPAGVEEGGRPSRREGETCRAAGECSEGLACQGGEGCGVAWTCMPPKPCTRDLVVYCGCDGQTFSGSGSCPPRPYARRGPCDGETR